METMPGTHHPLTLDILRECLTALTPVELLGMRLFQACPTDLPRETLREAVSEIIEYTGRCTLTAQRLCDLIPIPLTTVDVLEYGLVRRMAA